MDQNFENENEESEIFQKATDMLNEKDSIFHDIEDFELIADFYLENLELENTKIILDKGMNQYPNSPALLMMLCEYDFLKGDKKKALKTMKNIVEVHPYNVDFLLELANLNARIGDSLEAIRLYEKALTSDLEDIEAVYMDIVFECQRIKDFEKALAYLKKVMEITPDNEITLFEMGISYGELNREKEAIKFFKDYLDNDPYSYVAWFNLGNMYAKLGQNKKSVFAFDYSIVTNDKFPAAYYGKANAYIQLTEYKKAIKVLNSTFVLEQPHAFVYCMIGECHEKLEDYSKALYFYEKSIELDNDFADAWVGIGVVKDLTEKYQEAVKYMEKGIEKAPSNPQFWYLYAELLSKIDLENDAKLAFSKVIELDPNNTDAWLDYSNLLYENKLVNEATALLENGLKANEGHGELRYRLVAYLLKKGDLENAKKNLQLALEENYKGHEQLFDFYPASKEMNDIVEMIKKFK